MDLFDFMREDTLKREAPLASRLRPEKLDEIVGQRHILGKDKLLYRAIKADKLGSLIFYGPPGTGKTTLAMVIANTTSSVFRQINVPTGKGRSSSSMRSTGSTRGSRTTFCHSWRTGPSSSSAPLRKTRILK